MLVKCPSINKGNGVIQEVVEKSDDRVGAGGDNAGLAAHKDQLQKGHQHTY